MVLRRQRFHNAAGQTRPAAHARADSSDRDGGGALAFSRGSAVQGSGGKPSVFAAPVSVLLQIPEVRS